MNKLLYFLLGSLLFFSYLPANAKQNKKENNTNHTLRVERDWDYIWDTMEDIFYPDAIKAEIGYTYSSLAPINTMFPIGLYGEWTYSYLAVSGEMAAHLSRNPYKFSNKENETYDPLFYAMAGAGVNFNCFSINFNAGIVDYTRQHTEEYTVSTEGLYYSSSITTHKNAVAFIMQPSIHIHIPLEDYYAHFLSLKIGYNYCPKLPECNGLNIGIGFCWDTEY